MITQGDDLSTPSTLTYVLDQARSGKGSGFRKMKGAKKRAVKERIAKKTRDNSIMQLRNWYDPRF